MKKQVVITIEIEVDIDDFDRIELNESFEQIRGYAAVKTIDVRTEPSND